MTYALLLEQTEGDKQKVKQLNRMLEPRNIETRKSGAQQLVEDFRLMEASG